MKVTVYDSTGYDRARLSAWRVMVRELVESRELISSLVTRNLSGQFRQSFLGWIWVVLPPIATALVFTMLRTADVINIQLGADAMPYTLFALLGSTLGPTWQELFPVIAAGDMVKMEMSPYDLEKARITFRMKESTPPPPPMPRRRHY